MTPFQAWMLISVASFLSVAIVLCLILPDVIVTEAGSFAANRERQISIPDAAVLAGFLVIFLALTAVGFFLAG